MAVAKIFTHGGSQAVRLPKEFRFEGTTVNVRRVGRDVVLSTMPPAGADALIDALAAFDSASPLVRDQPAHQARQPIHPRR